MTEHADHATWNSHFGPFTAIARDDVVLASGWTADIERLLALIAPVDRPERLHAYKDLGAVTRAVRRFDRGEMSAIDGIAVLQRSGPFHAAVREQLRSIPPGEPCTYARLAAAAGRPRAIRAAGTACAKNATSLFVPCHRAIGTNGALHGFGWGLPLKEALLAHEHGHRGS
jgi:methylated-DNA-[protein]-cysteine S-methyltransferase